MRHPFFKKGKKKVTESLIVLLKTVMARAHCPVKVGVWAEVTESGVRGSDALGCEARFQADVWGG